jgi:hypothetical protein
MLDGESAGQRTRMDSPGNGAYGSPFPAAEGVQDGSRSPPRRKGPAPAVRPLREPYSPVEFTRRPINTTKEN